MAQSIRFTVDRDPKTFLPAIRRHLDAHGFRMVEVKASKEVIMNATRSTRIIRRPAGPPLAEA